MRNQRTQWIKEAAAFHAERYGERVMEREEQLSGTVLLKKYEDKLNDEQWEDQPFNWSDMCSPRYHSPEKLDDLS